MLKRQPPAPAYNSARTGGKAARQSRKRGPMFTTYQCQHTPRAVGRALLSNHSRAIGRALLSNHSRAIGRALSVNHSRAIGRALTANHSQAASAALRV